MVAAAILAVGLAFSGSRELEATWLGVVLSSLSFSLIVAVMFWHVWRLDWSAAVHTAEPEDAARTRKRESIFAMALGAFGIVAWSVETDWAIFVSEVLIITGVGQLALARSVAKREAATGRMLLRQRLPFREWLKSPQYVVADRRRPPPPPL